MYVYVFLLVSNCIGGIMVSVLVSGAVDRGFNGGVMVSVKITLFLP